MLTQTQLCQQLSELGIIRTERALTDWRARGLLPPLSQTSRGRGGSKWLWDDGERAFEQAIAVDCLLKKYARTNEALFALWRSGYEVDAKSAQQAWLEHLESQREAVEKAAARFTDGHLSVGKSLWRLFGKRPWLRDFVVPLVEASFDDATRDDDGYRESMADLIATAEGKLSAQEIRDFLTALIYQGWEKTGSKLKFDSVSTSAPLRKAIENCLALIADATESLFDEGKESRKDTYTFVHKAWQSSQLQTLLVNRMSIENVRSVTLTELDAARASLSDVRGIIRRGFELTNNPLDKLLTIQTELAFMTSVGLVIGNQLINFGRQRPEWPLARTLSTLKGFVMMVEFNDLSRHKNNKYQPSGRVLDAWTTTRLELSRLWSAVTK